MAKENAYFHISFAYGEMECMRLRFLVIKDDERPLEDCIKEGFSNATMLPLSKVEEILADDLHTSLVEETPLCALEELVQKSDVLVVNPTHFAVTLKMEEGGRLILTAKGSDEFALYMRQIAEKCGIPIVEHRPFARGAWAGIGIGETFPASWENALDGLRKKNSGRSKIQIKCFTPSQNDSVPCYNESKFCTGGST